MRLFEKPIVNVVRVIANPGKEDALREIILKSAGRALASPGNHGFAAYVAQNRPDNFLIIEHWDSRSQHLNHEADPAMPALFAEVARKEIVASGPEDTEWTQLT